LGLGEAAARDLPARLVQRLAGRPDGGGLDGCGDGGRRGGDRDRRRRRRDSPRGRIERQHADRRQADADLVALPKDMGIGVLAVDLGPVAGAQVVDEVFAVELLDLGVLSRRFLVGDGKQVVGRATDRYFRVVEFNFAAFALELHQQLDHSRLQAPEGDWVFDPGDVPVYNTITPQGPIPLRGPLLYGLPPG